jgi:hypothetical protein
VLAESLRRNDQLRVLMLRHNPIGFEGATALTKVRTREPYFTKATEA